MRHTRGLRRWTAVHLAFVALAALVVSGALIGVGSASTTTPKDAGVTFAPPSTASAASTATYTLRLQNLRGNQTIGSANIVVPEGFTISVSGAWAGSWTSTSRVTQGLPAVIELRAGASRNAILPGGTLLVTLRVTAPCATPAAPTWATTVKQSNDFKGTGNDFNVVAAPELTITNGGTPRLVIDTIDDPQQVGRPFDVTVRATCGTAPDTSFNGTASLTGITGAAYDPALPLTFTSGVATVEVTPGTAQDNVTLTATSAGRTAVPSNEFDVVQWLCTAEDEEEVCYAADELGRTEVRTPRPSGDTKLAISFDGRGGAGSCTGQTRVGSRVTIDPRGDFPAEEIAELTFTWDKLDAPGTGVANFVLCWTKPGEDPTIMEKCGRRPEPTCELKRSRTGVGDLEIVVLLRLQDPDFELG